MLSLVLPFAILLLSVFLPLTSLSLFRNPCFLFLLRVRGWKVRLTRVRNSWRRPGSETGEGTGWEITRPLKLRGEGREGRRGMAREERRRSMGRRRGKRGGHNKGETTRGTRDET